MLKHTKIYMLHFGYKIPEDVFCEIPGCGRMAKDVNHIQCRGMGGNPKGDKDAIENLIALCREHHLEYGDVPDKKEWLREIHLRNMNC